MSETPPPDPLDDLDLASLPVGAELPPDAQGRERYVCRCHGYRTRRRFTYLSIPVGAGLYALLLWGVLAGPTPAARLLFAGVIALFALSPLAYLWVGGHRLACVLRYTPFWAVAGPAYAFAELGSLP